MHINSYTQLWCFPQISSWYIFFCENFISYPKSDCETATYLIELLNNSHIPAVPRIFTYSSPLFLFSKRRAPTLNVALQGHSVQSASSHHAHKWGPAFEMLGTQPNTQPGWNQADFLLPRLSPFPSWSGVCVYALHSSSLEEWHILQSFFTLSHKSFFLKILLLYNVFMV